MLEEPITLEDNEAIRKAKTFYNTCMDICKYYNNILPGLPKSHLIWLYQTIFSVQIRKIGDEPLREVLDSLGGWPVTKDNWVPPNISIEVLLGTIRGIYNEGYLVEQWVGPDDKNSSVNIIQVRTK